MAGDDDWFQVQLVAGTTYTIRMNGSTVGAGTLADPFVYLHNSAGAQIASNDDISGSMVPTTDPNYNPNSFLRFTPTIGGTYYISARDFGDNSAGSYQINVRAINSQTATSFRDPLGDGTISISRPDGDGYYSAQDFNVLNTAVGANSFLLALTGTATVEATLIEDIQFFPWGMVASNRL